MEGGAVSKFTMRTVDMMHVDNDATMAERNLRRIVGDEEADREWLSTGCGSSGKKKGREKKRWAIVNLWRPLGGTVKQRPLALVTLGTSNGYGVTTDDGKKHKTPEESATVPIFTPGDCDTYFLALRPRESSYSFYYASDMRPDEALLFVDFDSSKPGRVSGLGHGAVVDNSPADAPLQRSIEVSVLVLWD